MQLIFDIETIPSQHPDAKAQARASIKPPGTLKKPESIAAWWDTEPTPRPMKPTAAKALTVGWPVKS